MSKTIQLDENRSKSGYHACCLQQHNVLHKFLSVVKENTWDEKKDEVAEAKMAWIWIKRINTISKTFTVCLIIADAYGIITRFFLISRRRYSSIISHMDYISFI